MEYKKGQMFLCKPSPSLKIELIILAIEQNYIMCRFKGCIPFVKYIKSFPHYLEELEAIELITKNK